jgi:hypothetical protein
MLLVVKLINQLVVEKLLLRLFNRSTLQAVQKIMTTVQSTMRGSRPACKFSSLFPDLLVEYQVSCRLQLDAKLSFSLFNFKILSDYFCFDCRFCLETLIRRLNIIGRKQAWGVCTACRGKQILFLLIVHV